MSQSLEWDTVLVGTPEAPTIPGWDTARLGPLRGRTVRLPRTGERLTIVQPTDLDRLLDLAQGDPEEQLPYWAEIWPSGLALADAILSEPDQLGGRRVIELGCGLGITAIAALRAGAELLITDYSAEALLLARWNCVQNVGRIPQARRFNWRRPESDFLTWARAPLPLVLAADILYERRDLDPLLRLVHSLVAPGGSLWLAEPGRRTAAVFVELLRAEGWRDDVAYWNGPWPEAGDATVRVAVHRLQRPPSVHGS